MDIHPTNTNVSTAANTTTILPDDEDDDNWSGDQDDESARDERAVDRVFAADMPNESEA